MINSNLFNKFSKQERNVFVQYSSMTLTEFFNVLFSGIKREYSYES